MNDMSLSPASDDIIKSMLFSGGDYNNTDQHKRIMSLLALYSPQFAQRIETNFSYHLLSEVEKAKYHAAYEMSKGQRQSKSYFAQLRRKHEAPFLDKTMADLKSLHKNLGKSANGLFLDDTAKLQKTLRELDCLDREALRHLKKYPLDYRAFLYRTHCRINKAGGGWSRKSFNIELNKVLDDVINRQKDRANGIFSRPIIHELGPKWTSDKTPSFMPISNPSQDDVKLSDFLAKGPKKVQPSALSAKPVESKVEKKPVTKPTLRSRVGKGMAAAAFALAVVGGIGFVANKLVSHVVPDQTLSVEPIEVVNLDQVADAPFVVEDITDIPDSEAIESMPYVEVSDVVPHVSVIKADGYEVPNVEVSSSIEETPVVRVNQPVTLNEVFSSGASLSIDTTPPQSRDAMLLSSDFAFESVPDVIKAYYAEQNIDVPENVLEQLDKFQVGQDFDIRGHSEMAAYDAIKIMVADFGSDALPVANKILDQIIVSENKRLAAYRLANGARTLYASIS